MPPLKNAFVFRWREMFSDVFQYCDAFVTTSDVARDVYQAAFASQLAERFHVIPHGRSFANFADLAAPVEAESLLRVLVPGNISPAKGADLIREMLDLDRGDSVEFHILGEASRLTPRRGLIFHGRYKRDEFADHVRQIRPHVGAVLPIWPETYCHTLTEMWSVGLPVVGIDVGAVGERIARHGGGWLLPLGQTAVEILRNLRRLRSDAAEVARQAAKVAAWQTGYGASYDTSYMAAKYDRLYREVMAGRRAFASANAAIRIVAVLGGAPGPDGKPSLFEAITRNDSATPAVFWRVGSLGPAALEEDAMAVDAVLVALEAVGRGDGARIVKIAQRRGVPLFLLVGTVSSTMADIDNKAWRRAESDRLLSAAAAVFALGEPANEWVSGRAANLHPLASSDPRIFGRIVAGEIEEFGGRAIRRAEQAFAQTTAM